VYCSLGKLNSRYLSLFNKMVKRGRGKLSLKGICHPSVHAQQFYFLSDRTFFKVDKRERNCLPSTLIVTPILKNCLVNHNRFKRQILCFELKTVDKYDVLERGFSNRLETKAAWSLGREDRRTKIRNL